MDGQNNPIVSSDDRTKTWLVLAGGALLTVGAVFALVAFWPSGSDDSGATRSDDSSTTATGFEPGVATTAGEGRGEPSATPGTGTSTTASPVALDLFGGDFPTAYQQLLAAAGDPAQLIEVNVYDTYASIAYRDPANPGNIDRRQWRDGEVSDAERNIIEDRVDESTEPSLFSPGELDPALLAGLVADAPAHYEVPTEVTHVIVDRFLPFDERVLIRVYATPTDGRSGGGYVSYDTAGVFVKVCC